MTTPATNKKDAATQNACRLCTPLGACLAFKGLERTVPLLHGSQGCATYIRRYMISHFREPVDIASSSFSEKTAVFGGESNLRDALNNVRTQYTPDAIGIATTCLSETIGDDVGMYLASYRQAAPPSEPLPELIRVSTPSYSGSHVQGYRDAVAAIVATLARPAHPNGRIGLIPSMISPEDLRYLKRLAADFNIDAVILPDYSDTLDGGFWPEYQTLPLGGTPIKRVRSLGGAAATIELGYTLGRENSPARALEAAFGVPPITLDLPLGVAAMDRFRRILEEFSGHPTPANTLAERGRLLDAYADAHKYLFGKRIAIYGEPDLVAALAAFVCEIGMHPVLCATGANGCELEQHLRNYVPLLPEDCKILENIDFADIAGAAELLVPQLMIGSSKGYKTARKLQIPLIRVGFPVHDRFGAQRLRMLGYQGTLVLLDRIVNAILKQQQDAGKVGYTYL